MFKAMSSASLFPEQIIITFNLFKIGKSSVTKNMTLLMNFFSLKEVCLEKFEEPTGKFARKDWIFLKYAILKI